MKSKRWSLIAVFAIVVALAACGEDNSSTTGSAQEDTPTERPTIGLVLPDTSTFPAYAGMKEGAEAQAAKVNANLVWASTTGEFTPQKYQEAIDSVATRGVKVIALDPYDTKLFAPTVKRLQAQGIKVVSVGNPDVTSPDAAVFTDTEGAIKAAMEQFIPAVGDTGEVGVLEFPGQGVVTQRLKFAKAALSAKGINVTAGPPLDTCNVVDGANATQDLLQAHPDLKGLFIPCGPPAIGAVKAAKQAGKNVIVYSYDGSEDELKAVKSGELAGTIAQRLIEIGAKAVDVMVDIEAGKPVDKIYGTGFDVVTKDNVDQFLKK